MLSVTIVTFRLEGIQIFHYLDDYLLLTPSSNILQEVILVCEMLRFANKFSEKPDAANANSEIFGSSIQYRFRSVKYSSPRGKYRKYRSEQEW